ncbi:hypothetical protein AnigIFM56816_000823 [Aspergillus niger]|uniref:SRPBCC family protein n=1 Tax=Aspergillus luchuensis (strain CBS 106.47) TaxID=1137211 RepID=A0A1M3T5Q0_ASPLC|nr:hypothetical protein ASPFODRAFT_51772 [Aspergillus luchuensis CBS 106.47]GKZ85975.1 hypothetical protein AnigIFM56816_000823 [Aspergillus niger]
MSEIITDVTVTINAPVGQVWGIVSSFGAESLWFPGVATSSLEGYGPGAIRTIHFEKNPWVNMVREQMDVCDPVQHLLRFRVFNDDVSDAGEIYSNMVLERIDDKSTSFRWFAEGQRLPDPSQHQDMVQYVEDMYRRCADAIGKKLARSDN